MKSGTTSAKGDAESDEEIWEGAVTGNVHITTIGTRAEKSVCVPAVDGAIGRGWELGADCVTQQALLHEQQPRARWPLAEVTWADDIV